MPTDLDDRVYRWTLRSMPINPNDGGCPRGRWSYEQRYGMWAMGRPITEDGT